MHGPAHLRSAARNYRWAAGGFADAFEAEARCTAGALVAELGPGAPYVGELLTWCRASPHPVGAVLVAIDACVLARAGRDACVVSHAAVGDVGTIFRGLEPIFPGECCRKLPMHCRARGRWAELLVGGGDPQAEGEGGGPKLAAEHTVQQPAVELHELD